MQQENEPRLALSGFGGEDHISPTQVLDEAAVEGVDDDYWDVHSDEEMLDAVDPREEDAVILGRDFSLIRRIHLENTNELAMRRYDAFIYEGVLTHYKAEQVANPLKNPKTARVFAHFIHVTGPVSRIISVAEHFTDSISAPSRCPFTIEIRETPLPSLRDRLPLPSKVCGRTGSHSRP